MDLTSETGRRRALLATAALSTVGFVALYLVAVRTGVGQRVDEIAVLQHRYDRTSDADATLFLRLAAGVLAVAGVSICWIARRRPALLLATAVGVPGAVVFANVLRRVVLGRVELTNQGSMHGASFPSGHTSAAVALAIALVLSSPRRTWRTFVTALALAGSVGSLVVLIPIHRPSDALAANLVGLTTMCLAVAVVPGAVVALGSTRPALTVGHQNAVLALGVAGSTAVWLAVSAVALSRAGYSLADVGAGYPIAVAAVFALSGAVLGTAGWLASSGSVNPAGPGGPA